MKQALMFRRLLLLCTADRAIDRAGKIRVRVVGVAFCLLRCPSFPRPAARLSACQPSPPLWPSACRRMPRQTLATLGAPAALYLRHLVEALDGRQLRLHASPKVLTT